MRIETVDLKNVKPNPENPRTIKGDQFKRLVKSIKEFPEMLELREIVVDENYVVLGGNMRLKALQEAGVKQAIVKVAEGLTEEQKREFVIKDNAAFGEWNFDDLANGWGDLPLADWGIPLPEDFLQQPEDPKDAEPQIDKAEELNKKWQVQSGDLWLIGEHRLLCGDSSNRDDIEKLLNDEMFLLAVTSPPYNQKLETFKPSGMQKENPSFVNRMGSSYFDSMPEDKYQEWQISILKNWLLFATENASCFYNHKIRYRDKRILSPMDWLVNSGWKIRQEIIWDRSSSITMNARMFIPADERIYWLKKNDDFVFNDTVEIKSWSTVWKIAAKNDISISAAFSTEIPTRCIMASSGIGDIVFEPFCGSGTTMVACQNLNRKCRAIEISPAYCAVILERMATAFPELKIEKAPTVTLQNDEAK